MKGGFGLFSAAAVMAVVLALSAGAAADGSADDCIDHVSSDGVVDDAEAEMIIAELQASEADDTHGLPEVCLYSFGCPEMRVSSELFSAVEACRAGMSVETRHGLLSMAPGSLDGMTFAEGTDVMVTVAAAEPYMFYTDFAEDGKVVDVELDNCGDVSMSKGMAVSLLFEMDGRHSVDDLEVYYLHGDTVRKDRVDGISCSEGCDGVTVTFGAERSGQYAVVYAEGSGNPDVNPWISLAFAVLAVVVVIIVADYIRKL